MCRLYQEDMSKQPKVNNVRFVTIWQKANSAKDVCKRLRMSQGAASGRAARMRKKGVKLKMFASGRGEGVNVKALNKLIGGGK